MIVCPTLHPSFLLRAGEGAAGEGRFLETVVHDFKRARELQRRYPQWDESRIWLTRAGEERPFPMFPNPRDAIGFCDYVRGRRPILYIDVEATGEHPLICDLICIGMGFFDDPRAYAYPGQAWRYPIHVINVPVLQKGGSRYWGADEPYVIDAMRRLMYDAGVVKCFQNGSYDCTVLWRHGMPVVNWSEDTMQGHHVIDGELPHGLAYQTSRYTEIPFYKDSVKGDERWIDKDDLTLRRYNLLDVCGTALSHAEMMHEVRNLGLEQLYRSEIRQAQIMMRATIRGVGVDLHRRDDPTLEEKPDAKGIIYPKGLGPKLRQQRAEALAGIRDISGVVDFNANSVPALRKLLFDTMGFPVVKKTDKGSPSTDKEAMVLLALHAQRPEQLAILKYLVKFRRADKGLSTYVEGLPILGDGRLHPTWKILLVSGRYGANPNVQALPESIRKIFCAAYPGGKPGDGMKLVGVDLSQAELRAMGYITRDPVMLGYYERGINVHTANCTLLFGVRNPGKDTNEATEADLAARANFFTGQDYVVLPMAPAEGWKQMRRLAKVFAFSKQYGAMPETQFSKIRSERDPETDELVFPNVRLEELEAMSAQWEKMHPAIVRWWDDVVEEVNAKGFYRCPVSGRISWFKSGKKRNDILNRPVQGMIASHMNRITEVADYIYQVAGDEAAIVMQVHDQIVTEAPDRYCDTVKEIYKYVLSRPFELPGLSNAVLPPDDPKVAVYLNEV